MNVILHMPHTFLNVPDDFYDGLKISKQQFNYYNVFMSDVCLDYLCKDIDGIVVKPQYSRLYCDVERFKDDSKEIMAKRGQGVIYTHAYDGTLFHENNQIYTKKVLEYYDEYHKKLDDLTKSLLAKDDTLLILDIHSFSDKMASFLGKKNCPDVCIGIEAKYFDEKILNKIISELKRKGLTYKINYPYSGSLVPNCIFSNKVKGHVISFMIEINKRIYLV